MATNLPILVAHDGSAEAGRALRWAAEESLRTHVPLCVLMVDEVLPPTWGGVSGWAPMAGTLDVPVNDATALIDGVRKDLADAGVGDARVVHRRGHVVDELLRAADSASVIVVGSHGHGAAGEALLGSVSQHLARHASCPVVVVREPHDPHARRIVVGIDGSRPSTEALELACRRAEETGETVVALHAWHVRVPSTDVWSSEPLAVETTERELLLAECVAGVSTDHPDVMVEQRAVPVSPARALVDASAEASLVVVGSRGLGFFSGLLLGSVSQAVLHRAACPVLVVR